MKTVLCVILSLIPMLSLAEGDPQDPPISTPPTATAMAGAAAGAIAGAAAGAIADATAGSNNEISQSVDASPSVTVGDIKPSSTTTVQIEGDDNPRQLAGFALAAGQNTEPGLKCFSLFGGNASKGQATEAAGIFCWLARDSFYLHEYNNYVAWDMPEPAARAYCKSEIRYGAFGQGKQGRAACEAAMLKLVQDMRPDQVAETYETEPEVEMVRRDWCDERLDRCQNAVSK